MYGKITLALALALATVTGQFAAGKSAGASISLFAPESLLQDGEGGIAFEQGLSTSIGLGGILSVPIGFAYHGVDGWVLEDEKLSSIGGPSLYGDVILPYAGLKAKLPMGALFVEASGGLLGAYPFRLKPIGQALESALAGAGESVALRSVEIERRFGLGYFAGAAIGLSLGKVSIDLGATWRSVSIKAPLEASIYRVPSGGGDTGQATTLSLPDAVARLRGISFQLGGSFSL
jgi:hypothetical protein